MSDLKKKLEALLALQEEYIQLVEEENPDCSETAAYYTELLEELKKSVRKNSMKYARTIIQNEYFQQCLMTPNASLYLPILDFIQMMFRGHKFLASAILKEEYMSKCSTLMNSREFSRFAMTLVEEEEKIRELQLRTAAAIIIQAFWRSILQRRKFKKIQNGFIQLQKLFRKKMRSRENDLWRNFRASERKFNVELNALKEKRKLQEKIFESIRRTPSSQLNLLFSQEKEAAAQKIQDCWRSHKSSTISEPVEAEGAIDPKIEQAALTIQIAARRWLTRRNREELAKSQPYLNKPITEERAMKLQQDIDAWQHHHKVAPMTSSEFAELHHKAQLKYAKFCQSLIQIRRREQKTAAVIAQSKNMIDILDNRPDLHSYNSQEDWKKFHSLPLHIATKARLDHNIAMANLDMPSWQRLLEE